jgi:hypothetical protein
VSGDRAAIHDRTGGAEPPGDFRPAAAAVVVFAVLSAVCAVTSDGFLTADALTHFQYARYAFHRPTYFVDVWGRPFTTALYAVPAALGGRTGVRLASLLLAVACALVARAIARGQGVRRPALALVFTLAQPLVFLNSFAEMTELPFALLAGAAFWAYQSRRWTLSALLVSIAPLARPEGFGLLLLAAVGLGWQRKFRAVLLLPLSLLVWDVTGWLLYGRRGPWWLWLVDNWPYSRDSVYPAGSVFQFVAMLPVVVGPFILPAVLIGAWLSLNRFRAEGSEPHPRRCALLTAAVPLGVLLVHSLLYRLGKMASYGEPRYLLVAAPFWAVLAARGWEWAFDRLAWRNSVAWAGVAALLPAVVNCFYPILPLRPPDHWRVARAFADRLLQEQSLRDYPRVLAAHPAVFYYLDVDPQDERRTAEWHKSSVAGPRPGTVLVWDPIYSARNADEQRVVTLEEVRGAGWIPMPGFDAVLNRPPSAAPRRPAPDPEAVLSSGEGWHVFRSPEPAPASVPHGPRK